MVVARDCLDNEILMSEPIRLTRQQVREIDRRSVEEFQIPGIVLMENAARAVTIAAMRLLDDAVHGAARGDGAPSALILCGGGNNGGDGLAVARHLHNRGVDVSIGLTVDPKKYQGDAATNWNIVRAMGVPVSPISPEDISRRQCDLIIDAIFGTGLQQAPRAPFGELAAAIRGVGRPVLAVDLPSGLDCDTGRAPGACIAATLTVTFVAEKAGFAHPGASVFTGEVVVGDIGCPIELIRQVGRQEHVRAGES
jgi:hydroxyethylthiazole kinase-like uncharacterized protein yjeF